MKKITLTLTLLLTLTTVVFSQKKTNKTMHDVMTDSLFNSMKYFCQEVIDDFTNTKITKKNVDRFINFLSKNSAEEVQSLNFLNPEKTKKDSMINYVREDLMTLVGSNVYFKYITWDGWDGESPYTMFRFDLVHKDYRKQFVVIVDTQKKVHTIFSVNSRF